MSSRPPRYVPRPTPSRERPRRPHTPPPEPAIIDDREVARRIASGDLRQLDLTESTPVDDVRVAELRARMAERRLGPRDDDSIDGDDVCGERTKGSPSGGDAA